MNYTALQDVLVSHFLMISWCDRNQVFCTSLLIHVIAVTQFDKIYSGYYSQPFDDRGIQRGNGQLLFVHNRQEKNIYQMYNGHKCIDLNWIGLPIKK